MGETYRLKTYHKTRVFYEAERGVFHATKSEAPEVFFEITDEALRVFSGDGDQRVYFSIDDNGTFKTESAPVDIRYRRNADGTISILKGDNWLAAVKGKGTFSTASQNVMWENFTLESTGSTPVKTVLRREAAPADKDHCTGCTACAKVCPKGAIEMVADDEGFISPLFNRSLCIDCNRCEAVCPIHHPNKHPAPDVSYAAWISDNESINRSSSGGIAYVISKRFIEDGGVVCGAAMEDFRVKHIIVDNIDDLKKLQGSKYVQSDLGDIFVEIKQLLTEGRKVLFTGTPCQVAGLRNFVGDHDENLTTIDLVCHGVPSPGVFNQYIDRFRQRYPTAKTVITRDCVKGWSGDYSLSIVDGAGEKLFTEPIKRNPYLYAFLRNVINRRSCANCSFSDKSRVGDITAGDFWNIKLHNPDLVNKSGTSIVFVNTEKGRAIYNSISDQLATNVEVPAASPAATQGSLKKPAAASELREKFFAHYKHNGDVESFLIDNFWDVGVVNLHYGSNMGAVIVAYATCKAIESLGYNVALVNTYPRKEQAINLQSFLHARLKMTAPCSTDEEFKKINPTLKKIVVGSDQVWKFGRKRTNMLDWASGYKSFISCAASFGDDHYTCKIPKATATKLLKRFDFISVREASGVDICKNDFGVTAVHIVDPTLLLTRDHYESLINPSLVKKPKNPYVAYMLFDDASKLIAEGKGLGDIRQKYELWNLIKNDKGYFRTVSSWLAAIRDADYIITNSFHGTVFSILFNKQVVSVQAPGRGTDRIPSLFKMFNIPQSRFYQSIEEITLKSFAEPINYDAVNPLVQKEREKGYMFLKLALSAPLNYKPPVV